MNSLKFLSVVIGVTAMFYCCQSNHSATQARNNSVKYEVVKGWPQLSEGYLLS